MLLKLCTKTPSEFLGLFLSQTNVKTSLFLIGMPVFCIHDNLPTAIDQNNFKTIKIASKIQQGIPISGTVTDDMNQPLPGATILEKGTKNGAQSDFNGHFSLTVKDENAVLEISFLGYRDKIVAVKNQTEINIQLSEAASVLEEVVLIGYGKKKKRQLTTAVSKIDFKNFEEQSMTSFEQAMAGQMPGVRITETTGAPGGNISIRVRGIGTTGDNTPLYVIDGVPLDNDLSDALGTTSDYEQPTNPLASIDPDDIESVQVLKDAASTAIYGSRGSNGVVIIQTKSGKKGKVKIHYKGRFSVQSVLKKTDLLDAYEYAQLSVDGQNENYMYNNPDGQEDRSINDPNGIRNNVGTIAPELYPYVNGVEGLTDTDWQDEIFRLTSMTNHYLTASGGTGYSNYYISGSLLKREGVVINSGYERTSMRIKYAVDYEKIKFGINLSPTYSKHDIVRSEGPWFRGGVVSTANTYAPVFPVYNPDGSFNYGNNTWGYGHDSMINPVATATLLEDTKKQYRLLGNAFVRWNLSNGFTFKTSFGGDINHYKRDTYSPFSLQERGESEEETEAIGRSRAYFAKNLLIENTLSYKKRLGGDHRINGIIGFSAQKNSSERNYLKGTGYPNDLVQTLNAASTITSGYSNASEWSMLSYFSRFEYDFNDKYFATFSMRTDGSSRFAPNNKWGHFPAVSMGWIVSEEAFFKENSLVDFLKLRVSYGQNGNFAIGNYEWISVLDDDNYVFGEEDGTIANGLKIRNLPNEFLTWEKTDSWNLGLELLLFDKDLELGLDLYKQITKDFLFEVPLPPHTGYDSYLENRGEIQNAGIELNASYTKKIGAVEISASAAFSKNKNKVLRLGPEGADIVVEGGAYGANYLTRIGEPISSYYLYVEDGVFENQAAVEAVPSIEGARPGDVRYVDVDKDGDIDADDRAIVGSYLPDYTLGGQLKAKYQNLDFGLSVTSVQGHEILNLHKRYSYNLTGNFNQLSGAVNRWKSEEDPGDGETIRAKSSTGNNYNISSRHVEDGSYVRIQNMTLGYKLPREFLKKFTLSYAKVWINVQNPFLWTKYSGYNPEVNARPKSPISAGEDYGSYPISRIFTLGTSFTF